MKGLSKNKILFLGLILSLFIALSAGLLGIFSAKNFAAFAETDNSNLKFVLNSTGDGYIVSNANRDIVEAVIPEKYNALPVTEVATSGFSGCTKLEYVIIPRYVTKVGANAFANCRSLQTLRGMAFVTEIGNNAFAMCSQLENLIIPPQVDKLGSNIIRNVPNDVYSRSTEAKLMSLNSNWNANSTATIIYGNDLNCSEIYDENDELIGFRIEEWQDLYGPDEDFELICSYEYQGEYYPILEIADSAFIFCEFNSITLKYDEKNIGTDYAIQVMSNAFYSVYAEYINVEVDINLEEDTESIFAFSTITSVKLPYSLDKITHNMFQSCENLNAITSNNLALATNHLSENVTSIGNNAFDGCTAFVDLYIPSSVNYIGGYAFSDWGNGQTIHIDLYGPSELWNKDWDSGIVAGNVSIEYKKVLVIFSKDGGSGGTDYIEVEYGKSMPDAIKPQKSGYSFLGYFSEMNGRGTQYYDEDMNGITEWNCKEPSILYAHWESVKDIPIKFNFCGGSDGTNEVTGKFNENMPNAEAPRRDGYTFQGYFEYPDGEGTQYYTSTMNSVHKWDKDVESATLYAYWIANKYSVILVNEFDESDDIVIEVIFGEPMPEVETAAPTLRGHSFKGYFSEADGQVTQYYSIEMFSVNNWDIPRDNVKLYPKFEANVYRVILLNREEPPKVLYQVTYGQPMPEIHIDPYHLDNPGYIFMGFGLDVDQLYYTSDLISCRNWDIPYDSYLNAIWVGEKYMINLDKQGGKGGTDSFVVTFGGDTPRITMPTRVGYKFIGYYTEIDGKGAQIYNSTSPTSYTWNLLDKDATLYACWEGLYYRIDFDMQGGSGGTPFCFATYGKAMSSFLTAPSRIGYTFLGYYSYNAGGGMQYFDGDMKCVHDWNIAENTTLYAQWIANAYTVVLDKVGGIGGPSYVTAYYDCEMPTNISAPTREGYIFQGYFSSASGKETQYYTSDMKSAHNWDIDMGPVVLYAHWIPVSTQMADTNENEVTILSTECLVSSIGYKDSL